MQHSIAGPRDARVRVCGRAAAVLPRALHSAPGTGRPRPPRASGSRRPSFGAPPAPAPPKQPLLRDVVLCGGRRVPASRESASVVQAPKSGDPRQVSARKDLGATVPHSPAPSAAERCLWPPPKGSLFARQSSCAPLCNRPPAVPALCEQPVMASAPTNTTIPAFRGRSFCFIEPGVPLRADPRFSALPRALAGVRQREPPLRVMVSRPWLCLDRADVRLGLPLPFPTALLPALPLCSPNATSVPLSAWLVSHGPAAACASVSSPSAELSNFFGPCTAFASRRAGMWFSPPLPRGRPAQRVCTSCHSQTFPKVVAYKAANGQQVQARMRILHVGDASKPLPANTVVVRGPT